MKLVDVFDGRKMILLLQGQDVGQVEGIYGRRRQNRAIDIYCMAMPSNAEQMKAIKDKEVEWVSKMQSCEQNV